MEEEEVERRPKRGVAWQVLDHWNLPKTLGMLYQKLQEAYERDHGEETSAVAAARAAFYNATIEAIGKAQDVDESTHKITVVYRPARVDFAVSEIRKPTAVKSKRAYVLGGDDPPEPMGIKTIKRRK